MTDDAGKSEGEGTPEREKDAETEAQNEKAPLIFRLFCVFCGPPMTVWMADSPPFTKRAKCDSVR
jgi:hypothetical protein